METIIVPPTGSQPDRAGISYDERRHISSFKGFDWSKATKEDAVHFARCTGFKETGMSVNEIGLLFDCLEKRKPKTIVELGRNYGCSTRLFMQHVLRHRDAVLDSWDLKHWEGFIDGMMEAGYGFEKYDEAGEIYSEFCQEVPDMTLHAGIVLRVGHSIKTPVCEHLEKFGVDFLLIDTEHGLEHALGEYMRWREYLRSGAMIAFHDSELPAVARAIELVKEVESTGGRDRIVREYKNECVDGFGIHVLEWKG